MNAEWLPRFPRGAALHSSSLLTLATRQQSLIAFHIYAFAEKVAPIIKLQPWTESLERLTVPTRVQNHNDYRCFWRMLVHARRFRELYFGCVTFVDNTIFSVEPPAPELGMDHEIPDDGFLIRPDALHLENVKMPESRHFVDFTALTELSLVRCPNSDQLLMILGSIYRKPSVHPLLRSFRLERQEVSQKAILEFSTSFSGLEYLGLDTNLIDGDKFEPGKILASHGSTLLGLLLHVDSSDGHPIPLRRSDVDDIAKTCVRLREICLYLPSIGMHECLTVGADTFGESFVSTRPLLGLLRTPLIEDHSAAWVSSKTLWPYGSSTAQCLPKLQSCHQTIKSFSVASTIWRLTSSGSSTAK